MLVLTPGRGDVGMPALRHLAARELDRALVEGRLELQQQNGLLDVEDGWHDFAEGSGCGAAGGGQRRGGAAVRSAARDLSILARARPLSQRLTLTLGPVGPE